MGRSKAPSSTKEYQKIQRRQKRIRRTLELYRLYDNMCQRCGYESFTVGFFDLHHVVPEEKETTISKIILSNWDKVLDEAQKCLLLCPNCHRLEHIEMRENAEMMEYIDVE